jgi:hypothetical protein
MVEHVLMQEWSAWSAMVWACNASVCAMGNKPRIRTRKKGSIQIKNKNESDGERDWGMVQGGGLGQARIVHDLARDH